VGPKRSAHRKRREDVPVCRANDPLVKTTSRRLDAVRACLHEQLISYSERFKPAFAKRDKKQTIMYFPVIPTNWFKNQLYPSIRLAIARLWAQDQIFPML
jgi:hypothetical protein